MSDVTADGIDKLIFDPRVLRAVQVDQTWYSAVGVVQVLTEAQDPEAQWRYLKQSEPALEALSQSIEFLAYESEDLMRITDGLTLDGVLRLVMKIDSPRAEMIKRWLVESALQRMQESIDPEQALERVQRLYEQHGYSRRWIARRLSGLTTRNGLAKQGNLDPASDLQIDVGNFPGRIETVTYDAHPRPDPGMPASGR